MSVETEMGEWEWTDRRRDLSVLNCIAMAANECYVRRVQPSDMRGKLIQLALQYGYHLKLQVSEIENVLSSTVISVLTR